MGLVAYVGWPLPSTIFPHSTRSNSPCASGIDPQLLINTLAVIVWVVWVVWIQLVYHPRQSRPSPPIRGRTVRRLPVLPGLQPAVAQLVAAVTLGVATMGPLRTLFPAAATPLQAQVALASSYPTLELDNGQEPVRTTGGRILPHTDVDRWSPFNIRPTGSMPPRHPLAASPRPPSETVDAGRRSATQNMRDGPWSTATASPKPPIVSTPGWVLVLPDRCSHNCRRDRRHPGTRHSGGDHRRRRGDNFWTIAEDSPRNRLGTLAIRHRNIRILAAPRRHQPRTPGTALRPGPYLPRPTVRTAPNPHRPPSRIGCNNRVGSP